MRFLISRTAAAPASIALCMLAFASVGSSSDAFAAINPAVPQNVHLVALPDLTVSARTPAYTLNSGCSTGGAAIIFHLTVSNIGVGNSGPIAQSQGGVMIQTSMQSSPNGPGSVWGTAAALPTISGRSSVQLDVSMPALRPSSGMEGTHVFSAFVNPLNTVKEMSTTNNSTNITVTIPKGFCPNMTAAPPVMVHPLFTPHPGLYSNKMSTPLPNPPPGSNGASSGLYVPPAFF
jgi:hypothetical protein